MKAIEKDEIGAVNYALERIRLERRKLDYRAEAGPVARPRRPSARRSTSARQEQKARYAELEEKLAKRMEAAGGTRVDVPHRGRAGEGAARARHLPRLPRERALLARASARVYASRLWGFLADEPREANTEGGIFPAIFGTVMMVFLMSLAVVPLGVLAALYLREYARQGPLVRTVRIAVNNLAGVPSIVFGVFGLGFFVYFVGGGDRPDLLPRGAADARPTAPAASCGPR